MEADVILTLIVWWNEGTAVVTLRKSPKFFPRMSNASDSHDHTSHKPKIPFTFGVSRQYHTRINPLLITNVHLIPNKYYVLYCSVQFKY